MEGVHRRRAGGDGMIDHYLAELRRRLRFRPFLRSRLTAEAESHLRESAEALGSEQEAVARFGPPERIAAAAIRGAAPRGLFRSALLLLGGLALFVFPLYGIPENTLPPAPWSERPEYLTWKLYASLGAYCAAVGAALPAAFAAWRGWARAALGALVACAAAIVVSASFATVLAIQWTNAVPGSGTTLALTLTATVFATGLAFLVLLVGTIHAAASIGRRGRCIP